MSNPERIEKIFYGAAFLLASVALVELSGSGFPQGEENVSSETGHTDLTWDTERLPDAHDIVSADAEMLREYSNRAVVFVESRGVGIEILHATLSEHAHSFADLGLYSEDVVQEWEHAFRESVEARNAVSEAASDVDELITYFSETGSDADSAFSTAEASEIREALATLAARVSESSDAFNRFESLSHHVDGRTLRI